MSGTPSLLQFEPYAICCRSEAGPEALGFAKSLVCFAEVAHCVNAGGHTSARRDQRPLYEGNALSQGRSSDGRRLHIDTSSQHTPLDKAAEEPLKLMT